MKENHKLQDLIAKANGALTPSEMQQLLAMEKAIEDRKARDAEPFWIGARKRQKLKRTLKKFNELGSNV